MKKIIEEVDGEGLESLLGEYVTLWCCRYIYAGKLTGVNEKDVILSEAKIVYETGELNKSGFNDSQSLPSDWYIRTDCIESYGLMK
jgi:hypothetical protein